MGRGRLYFFAARIGADALELHPGMIDVALIAGRERAGLLQLLVDGERRAVVGFGRGQIRGPGRARGRPRERTYASARSAWASASAKRSS